jgi:uncharacterized protein (DUF885 family)
MQRRDWLKSGFAIASTGLLPMSAQPENTATNATTKSLYELFASEWDYRMEYNPTWASTLGDRRWNDRWPDVSLEAIACDHQHSLDVIGKLKSIDRSVLAPKNQLNYDLFQKDYEYGIEAHQYRWYLVPLNQRGGIQTANELVDALRFETAKDYEDWVTRLRAFPVYMDQTIALMREGIRERMVLPKVIMLRIPAQIDKQIVAEPAESPFYKPFRRFPSSLSEEEQRRLAAAASAAIKGEVVPAFRRFKQFFVGEYLPASFDQVGAWQMPNGEQMYAFLARRHTTTRMTPEEIHMTGLSEVQRIRADMEASKEKAGFKGSLGEFFQFLRTDPRFHYNTSDELLTAYRALAKRIDPNLVKVFSKLPRLPYGVEPIPEASAPDTTAAYYFAGAADGSRAGTYYVNLYKPEARPKWEMVALSLHESVPGHHLQIALAMEQGELPNFRRYGGYDAFVEGWGLYAESLGKEMGLYDDPYVDFGRLTYDMWRAVRLVVDTGMHVQRWDRQRAINYFMENAAKTELDVVNEIDRYIAWPGQALAYKIGQLKIKELRSRASEALGKDFDLREFHDVVLREGALPLDILERNVGAWIQRNRGVGSKQQAEGRRNAESSPNPGRSA